MTLDERIEALTQSVEMLASMHKDTEKRFDELASTSAKADSRFEQLATAAAQNEKRSAQLMDTMNRVGRILEAYDIRMDDHEQRIDRLERPGA